MDPDLEKAADLITRSRLTVAMTGAGISVESGIPPFRGKGGLWERFDPMEVAHIDSFMRNPAHVWDILVREMKKVIDRFRPNAAHTGLARLEEMGRLAAVITQNVDGLHQKAGSREVIEYHGNFAWQRCVDCSAKIETEKVDLAELPPRCSCGGILRPDCVFFGEQIPLDALERSHELATSCDVMLVVGSSATVQPAASLPVVAKGRGAAVIEINLEPTPLSRGISDITLLGRAGDVLTRILQRLAS